jgi:hypothetical protein
MIITASMSAPVAVLSSFTRLSGTSGVVQVTLRFLPLDCPDVTDMFDLNKATYSSSLDLVLALQNPPMDDGLESETLAGARNALSCLSADLNLLLASPGAETDPGIWRSTPE